MRSKWWIYFLPMCFYVLFGTRTGFAQSALETAQIESPRFSRHVIAVFSRLGCNAGSCHGAVQGRNGFRLSLFGARPELDYAQLVRDQAGRRINLLDPENSLILLKATERVAHGGGRITAPTSAEFNILRRWISQGAPLDQGDQSRLINLQMTPREQVLKPGAVYRLHVEAEFADGSKEDVTDLCAFQSLDNQTAAVDRAGRVTAVGVGDVAILARFRDEPILAMALITRDTTEPFPDVKPLNFVDEQILTKLRRLNIPPADVADDVTFLRRVRLDVTGQMPTPNEIRDFLADTSPDKRFRKIDQLLNEPGYAALWTLKFCDLLGASDFGVYADGLAEHFEAPRFQAWVRARLEENLPYDEFAARILMATSRDGRSREEWAQEVVALQEGYTTPRKDLEIYAKRKTLDIYWQRRDAIGVPGAMQVAHAFLGLRLQCAQCHRHPHDVWQQDDVLSFANFFVRVRRVGFEGENEKKFPEEAKLFKQFEADGKRMGEEAKKLKEGKVKQLGEKAKQAEGDRSRLKNEIAKAEQAGKTDGLDSKRAELVQLEQTLEEHKSATQEANDLERRGRLLGDEVAKRVLHAGIFHRTGDDAQKSFAQVESPLGSQSSRDFRLLGERQPLSLTPDEDPRERFVAWLRKPDNPYFAKAIVNRVWAHYFDRGLIDPPDDLSPLNPCSHPVLLEELTRRFVEAKYDLKWLHRTILQSRTYQQSSSTNVANATDRTNYSHFALRRLPAEVLLDAVNQSTGTRDEFDMKYYHWPENLTTVEIPYATKNEFVTFVLEQFGRSERNSSVQCDCQRQSEASMLQVLGLANHPRIWQKVTDPRGRVTQIMKQTSDPSKRVEELYLGVLGRLPDPTETAACLGQISTAESPEKGLQTILWCLLNTKEFLLQH
jgi:hypothetical protein